MIIQNLSKHAQTMKEGRRNLNMLEYMQIILILELKYIRKKFFSR